MDIWQDIARLASAFDDMKHRDAEVDELLDGVEPGSDEWCARLDQHILHLEHAELINVQAIPTPERLLSLLRCAVAEKRWGDVEALWLLGSIAKHGLRS